MRTTLKRRFYVWTTTLTLLLSAVLARPARASFLVTSSCSGTRTFSSSSRSIMSLRKRMEDVIGTSRGGGGRAAAPLHASSSPLPAVVFDSGPFFRSQKIFLGANLLGYLLNLVTSSHYHVDLLGTGAFALAALPSLFIGGGGSSSSTTTTTMNNINPRIRTSATAMALWSVKLASFLLFRVIEKGGHDARLDDILNNPVYSAGFWGFSLFWGMLCSLPHTLGTTSSSLGNPLALQAGAAMFGLGWIIETLADYQKYMFKKSHPASDFCNTGLWSISQHPNWFGNLLLWSGIFVMNAPALIEPIIISPANKLKGGKLLWAKLWSYRRFAASLISPLFMWYLFSGQATGSILADSFQATQKRYGYGTEPSYTKYIDSTPLIVPNPLKWFSTSD